MRVIDKRNGMEGWMREEVNQTNGQKRLVVTWKSDGYSEVYNSDFMKTVEENQENLGSN